MNERHLLPALLLAAALSPAARADRLGGNYRGPGDVCDPREDPVPPPAEPPAAALPFLRGIAEGRSEAEFAGKPMLVFLVLEGCLRCGQVEDGAFRDPEVQDLAARFVAVRVGAEEDEAFAVAHAVRTLPTILVLGPAARELGRAEGPVGAAPVAELLRTALRRFGPPRPTRAARDLARAAADLDRARAGKDWRSVLRAVRAIEGIDHEGDALAAARAARKAAGAEAAARLADAKVLLKDGKRPEARRALTSLAREFQGLDEAVEARNLLLEMEGPAPGGGGGGGTGSRVPPSVEERMGRGEGDIPVPTSAERRGLQDPAPPGN